MRQKKNPPDFFFFFSQGNPELQEEIRFTNQNVPLEYHVCGRGGFFALHLSTM